MIAAARRHAPSVRPTAHLAELPHPSSHALSQTLLELLDQAFVSGQQVTCHAVYYSKSGLPWMAELTLAPLLDSSKHTSSYCIHLLRPAAETSLMNLLSIADAS